MSADLFSGPARAVQRRVARRLADAGIGDGGFEARLLVERALGCGAVDILSGRAGAVEGVAAERLAGLLQRRLAHEPIAYIFGEREFWSLPIAVSPDVLIPRPDSETLIEAALRSVSPRDRPLRVLDLGTGSGCLLLALLSEWPDAIGIGIDISQAALRMARDNAVRLCLDDRAAFVCSDWDDALGDRKFDLVVSNPPYISEAEIPTLAPDIRRFEPILALSAGVDGLAAYRRVLPACRRLLAPAATAFIEIPAALASAVGALARAEGLQIVDVKPDISAQSRCLVVSA